MEQNGFGVPLAWAGGTGLTSIAEVRAEARYASDGGFDSFWVSQIFGVDPFVALAAIADDLGEIREVGTSVVPLYGRHPLAMAAQARTTQDAVGGRFTLGIGPSHAVFVEGFYGESYARPYSRTAEFVSAIDPLLRGEPTDVEGAELTSKGWLTVQSDPVPLVLAAMGTRMLKLAGSTTAGTMLGFAVGPRTIANHIAPIIREAASASDRPEPRVIASVDVAITEDVQAVLAAGRETSAMYADLPAYRAMLDREGVETPTDLTVAGSEQQVLEGLQEYVDAGATELRLAATGPPEVEAFTRQALPQLLQTV